MASTANSPSDLYERDYYAWLQDQVRALRERRIEDVDWENVAEEIEDLGKSERRGIESQLSRLAEHLLKLAYIGGMSREYDVRGWRMSVRGARFSIQKLLKESPSLRTKLAEMLPDAYHSGRLDALRDARVSEDDIPELSPWTVEQLMDGSFLP
jgi:Domain of unknown function DUF29